MKFTGIGLILMGLMLTGFGVITYLNTTETQVNKSDEPVNDSVKSVPFNPLYSIGLGLASIFAGAATIRYGGWGFIQQGHGHSGGEDNKRIEPRNAEIKSRA